VPTLKIKAELNKVLPLAARPSFTYNALCFPPPSHEGSGFIKKKLSKN